jgi:hypothetical protein
MGGASWPLFIILDLSEKTYGNVFGVSGLSVAICKLKMLKNPLIA